MTSLPLQRTRWEENPFLSQTLSLTTTPGSHVPFDCCGSTCNSTSSPTSNSSTSGQSRLAGRNATRFPSCRLTVNRRLFGSNSLTTPIDISVRRWLILCVWSSGTDLLRLWGYVTRRVADLTRFSVELVLFVVADLNSRPTFGDVSQRFVRPLEHCCTSCGVRRILL